MDRLILVRIVMTVDLSSRARSSIVLVIQENKDAVEERETKVDNNPARDESSSLCTSSQATNFFFPRRPI